MKIPDDVRAVLERSTITDNAVQLLVGLRGAFFSVEQGAFREAGTDVRTVLARLVKA